MIIQKVNRLIGGTNEVMCRDIFFQIHWFQKPLKNDEGQPFSKNVKQKETVLQ